MHLQRRLAQQVQKLLPAQGRALVAGPGKP
jgi:hypothetical protein